MVGIIAVKISGDYVSEFASLAVCPQTVDPSEYYANKGAKEKNEDLLCLNVNYDKMNERKGE